MCRCPAVFKPWQWVGFGPDQFSAEPILQYAIYFFAGLRCRSLWLRSRPARAGWRAGAAVGALWAAAAPAAFLLWIIPTALIVQATGPPCRGCRSSPTSASCWLPPPSALPCWRYSCASPAVHQPILHGLSENAYGIYFIHYLFVIWLQYLLLGAALPAVAKGCHRIHGHAGAELGCDRCVLQPSSRRPPAARKRRVSASAPAPANGRYSKAEASDQNA